MSPGLHTNIARRSSVQRINGVIPVTVNSGATKAKLAASLEHLSIKILLYPNVSAVCKYCDYFWILQHSKRKVSSAALAERER